MAITLGLKVHALERFMPESHRPAFEGLKAHQEQDSRRYEERREREHPARLAKEREAQLAVAEKMLRLTRSPELPPLDRENLTSRAFAVADALTARRDAGDRLRVAVRHLEQQYDFLRQTREREPGRKPVAPSLER